MSTDRSGVPARAVLTALTERQARVGHSEEGFVSLSHGFLPVDPPLRALPPSHRAWDDIAAELPALYRMAGVRRAVEALPLLPTGPEHLPAEALCRAAAVVGILAHAYAREREMARVPLSGGDALARYGFDADKEGKLPACLELPWHALGLRLGRPGACLAFSDLILYNWHLRDPNGPRVVENLQLNIPTTGVAEERAFYLTMVESLAVTAPALGLMVQAQEAAMQDDLEALRFCLASIGEALRTMTVKTLHKIDPNPYSRHHTDPIVWSRFVAPLAAPVRMVEPGLSGAAAPVFHLFDAFFGRQRRDTKIGREMKHLAQWTPANPLALIEAVRQVSLWEMIDRTGNPELMGLWRQTLELYAGSHGWLGAHRLKVYGFMETGFKAGRTSTNGGFSGKAESRAWERLDNDIDESRRERFLKAPGYSLGRKVGVTRVQQSARADLYQVSFDIAGRGLRYRAGDRCAVLPQNSQALVERTVLALRASLETKLALDRRWSLHMSALQGTDTTSAVPLGTFLTHGQLRPLGRTVAKQLYALSRSPALLQVIEAHREDELELADALALMSDANYDVQRLWQASPWEPESITRIVLPAQPRVYSIASAPDAALPTRIDLAVRHLRYQAPDSTGRLLPREGAASTFLTAAPCEDTSWVALRVIAPPRFSLPADSNRPIVMFAGGSGFAPFRGFMQARVAQAGGTCLMVLGIGDEAQLPFRSEIEDWVQAGSLELFVALSQEPAQLHTQNGTLVRVTAPRGHVDGLIGGVLADRLSELLQPAEPESGAVFYVCGSSRFAHTVVSALQALLQQRCADTKGELFAQLVAQGRLMQDIFTTFAPAGSAGITPDALFDASEVVLHNNPESGYWMVLHGRVFDLSKFLATHPGGHQILIASAGTDASRSYEAVEHHVNPEVHAMLDLFRIGSIRRLDFQGHWGITLMSDGVQTVTLQDCYAAWLRTLYKVVEMENSIQNNQVLRTRPSTQDEPALDRNVLKARVLLELRTAFERSLLDAVIVKSVSELWQLTVGLLDPAAQVDALGQRMRQIRCAESASQVERLLQAAHQLLSESCMAADSLAFERAWSILALLEDRAKALLQAIKMALREGAIAFEQHADLTLSAASTVILDALQAMPDLFAEHQQSVCKQARELGLLSDADVSTGALAYSDVP